MRRKKFDYRPADLEAIEASYVPGRRLYTVPGGAVYPSVTTVIGESLDKSGLEAWRELVGPEEAERVSLRARTNGTRLHRVAESYLLNEEHYPPGSNFLDVENFKSVRRVLDERVGVVRGVECPLYSHGLRTAGRSDAVAEFDGELSVLDFKTSARIKYSQDILGYFLQSTCYAAMFMELTGLVVENIAIIIAVTHDSPQVFKLPVSTYAEKTREVFLHRDP